MNNDWREYANYDPQYTLMHHGIKGQKWGVRRFENADGTLTAAGRSRYGDKADRVEKYSKKAATWEQRAINAKTGIGREVSTAMAIYRRGKADKLADKATGGYKALRIHQNAARSSRSAAESQANIAAGFKKRADEATSSRKQKKLMEAAIKNLAGAENSEGFGAKMNSVANAKVGTKTYTFIKKTLTETTYTSAGRKLTMADRVAEAIGDQVISSAMNTAKKAVEDHVDNNEYGGERKRDMAAKGAINVAATVASRGVVSNVRDAVYKSKNDQKKRWDRMARG